MKKIIMPKLGLTMEEGTILHWHVSEGESIRKGEILFEVETDKAVNEVEATNSGKLGKIVVPASGTATVLQVIAYLLEEGEEPPEEWPEVETMTTAGEAIDSADKPKPQPRATPLALRLAKEKGVDLANLEGSGENGTIVKEDVLRVAESAPEMERPQPKKVMASPRAKRLAREKGIPIGTISGSGPGGRVTEDDVLQSLEESNLISPSRIQAITAQRLSTSFNTTPHFYLRIETKADQLLSLRTDLLPEIANTTGVRVTITDILLVLISKTLEKHPLLNASWEEGNIRTHKDINVGIATTVEEGLVVPVIKNTNIKLLSDITAERFELVEKAKFGKLNISDLEGGTFTFTNLGMFGIDDFDAIINPPQSAILAAGQIAERPFVEEGNIIAMPTLRISLAIDHRVLDGAIAAHFLSDLKDAIENPAEIIK